MFGQIQRKPYRRFDLDLGIARTAEQFFEVGSFIWVEECDGVVEIKLNDNQAAFFKLIDGAFYKVSEYKQFWIKNAAQAGKSLKALIGDADFFRSVMRGVYDHIKLKNVSADQHADTKIGTKVVDETNIADTKHLEFKTASGKIEYVAKPAGGAGDMEKSTYDTGDNGVVDNSEKLEGSTKAQVQDHTPKAHTLASHSTKAHSELSDAPTSAHHVKTVAGELNLADLLEKSYASLTNKPTVVTTISHAVVGTLETGGDQAPTIVAPCALTIVKAKIVVKTAPTGASIIVDVNKNGTTIFTTQANRPEIAISGTTDDSGTPDVTALAETDKITIDIDQVGSTVAGADLTVELVCTQAI